MNIHKKAYQYGDEWQCHYCAKAWDVKDLDIPKCETKQEHNRRKIKELRRQLSSD